MHLFQSGDISNLFDNWIWITNGSEFHLLIQMHMMPVNIVQPAHAISYGGLN